MRTLASVGPAYIIGDGKIANRVVSGSKTPASNCQDKNQIVNSVHQINAIQMELRYEFA
jgi:hypothetical protein